MQTELHRHLDVSIRTSTLLKLAQERGLEAQSTSLEAFSEKLVMKKPMTDLTEVLAQFVIFQKVLDRPEVLEQVAMEVVGDCYREGTRKLELRFSPNFVSEYSKLSWNDVLTGFENGIERALRSYPDMRAGLLCIATRDYGVEAVDATVEFFLKNRSRFAGFDLAGNEVNFPCRLFSNSFKKLRKAGAKITVHAGEASGPDYIWEALDELGARRIGHGISAIQDPKLLDRLRREKICLEMCPTSNWLTGAVKDFKLHPLIKTFDAGVPVCINTDDPAIFGVTLPHEIEICTTQMGMSAADVAKCFKYADLSSFLTES